MTRVFNKSTEIHKRRTLRRNMPEPEKLLWAKLRDKELHGHKFRRQYSVDKFVLDFYCPQQKLAIEIDGDSHFAAGAGDYDKDRQQIIESYGIRFLRFTNADVIDNIDGVVLRIMEYLQEPPLAPPWQRRALKERNLRSSGECCEWKE